MVAASVSVAVELAAGNEASGLACMLASLLEDNVRDFRSRSLAARLTRGDVVLLASDRGVAVTLSFRPGEILVEQGAVPGAPVLAGKWLDLTKVCSGQRSPIAAIAARELRVTTGRGMRVAAGAGVALSVPRSFYEDKGEVLARRRRVVIIASVVLTAVLVTGIVFGRRRRTR